MKIQLRSIGKNHESYTAEGILDFTKRINHYYPADWKIINAVKNSAHLDPGTLKLKEGELLLSLLQKEDYLVLLDEKGKMFSSEELAGFLQKQTNGGVKNLIFLIGGAFGVSDAVKERADKIWSLSELVFPHQLVRLILAEQLYRACTIIKNEKYHHK